MTKDTTTPVEIDRRSLIKTPRSAFEPELEFVITDVHGCYDQLLVAMAKIKHASHGRPYRVVFCGDYVDRGPESAKVVKYVRSYVGSSEGIAVALKGNHEDIFWSAMNIGSMDKLDTWYANGGKQTEDSYKGDMRAMARDAEWLHSLPTSFETDHYYFVHAGVSPRYSLADQPDSVKMWIRGWDRDDHDFGKHIVYGHTPRTLPMLRTNSTGLDTGACYDGVLTVGVFDAKKRGGPIELLVCP